MRFLIPDTPPTELGEARVIETFLWFPRRVAGQVRWLEFAKIEQEARFVADGWPDPELAWVDIAWSCP